MWFSYYKGLNHLVIGQRVILFHVLYCRRVALGGASYAGKTIYCSCGHERSLKDQGCPSENLN